MISDSLFVFCNVVNAEIEVAENNVFTLPKDAIVNYENKSYAFKVKGKSSFEMMEVKTGVEKDGFVELTLISEISRLKDSNS